MLLYRALIAVVMALVTVLECPISAQEQVPQNSVAQSERLQHSLTGHPEIITSVAFSSDGKHLVSGGQDGTLILWDVGTASLLRTMRQEREVISSVAISPNGSMIVVGSAKEENKGYLGNEGALTFWDLKTGERQRRLVVGASISTFSEPSWVVAVSFSPDGKIVAGGSADGTIRLWDSQTGKLLRQLNRYGKRITSVAFSPDRRLLASGSWDGTIVFWETQTWKEKAKVKQDDVLVSSISFSPDGKTLVSGATTLRKQTDVSVTTIQGMPTLGDNVIGVSGYHLQPNGSVVKLWDVDTGKEKLVLARSRDIVGKIVFAPDGRTVACAVSDKTVRVVVIKTGEVLTLKGHDAGVISVAFSPDGQTLASAGKDKSVKLWSVGETK